MSSPPARGAAPDDEQGAGAVRTTGAVARTLGVSPATIRSWERRYGIGPARREDGRHRRWTPDDVATVQEMCRLAALGVPPAEAARAALEARTEEGEVRTGRPATAHAAPGTPNTAGTPNTPAVSGLPGTPTGAGRTPGGRDALPLGDVRQECRGLARAAVRLDAPAVTERLAAALSEYGLVTAWEEIIMPTLHAVGRKWATAGERYVEVEHLLSWQVSCALRGLVGAPSERTGLPPALLACTPQEQHSLPLEALAAGLAQRGLPVRMFGPALPAEALSDAVRRLGPALVVLWSQSRTTAQPELARRIAGIGWGVKGARRHPVLLLAGPGWAGTVPAPGWGRPTGLRPALRMIESHLLALA
ncbi:MerR family transcriptional regulator [Streptomyces sp. NPDC059070]|uniref:MerR family transcriptional regulator n=1 Tax=unclassified Streptomyces TaxID=2593676 RepID=UPI0034E2E4D6